MSTRATLLHCAALGFCLCAAAGAAPRAVSITQIDSTLLLPAQLVDLYVSLTDEAGRPVEGARLEDFRLSESADGTEFRRVDQVTRFEPRAGAEEGITFLLLVDNSGSMYDTLEGRPTAEAGAMRIEHAKEAIRSFLGSVTSPKDAVGLASYNTFYTEHAAPRAPTGRIAGFLDDIRRPSEEEAYTELYASLQIAAGKLRGTAGRKAIIVLSDGENYPYARHSGKPHPEHGARIVTPAEPIRTCQEEGVTVYAVNLSVRRDQPLQEIARETGGRVFDAFDRAALESVYRAIHEQVRGEYLLRYRAGMEPAERRYVRVELISSGAPLGATRFYFAGSLFGVAAGRLSPLLAVALAAAALALWLLTRLRLERPPGPATLEVLQTVAGRPATRVTRLGSAKTVIGGSARADLTIVGSPQIREEHATVLYDPAKKAYTVVASGGEITVNNRPVTTRVLEDGDVIDVGGATIVFDGGSEPKR